MSKLAEILALNPDDEKRLHPYALQCLKDWRAETLRLVPQLGKLGIEDVNSDLSSYLDEDERTRATKCMADISKWLYQCRDIGVGYSPYPYSTSVIGPFSELQKLAKMAY